MLLWHRVFLTALCRAALDGWQQQKEASPDPAGFPQMFARLFMAQALKITLENGLRILTMEPLSKM
jgi:hypothetical protein